jgi:membrane protein implicated in regulation of membrane protease activity
MEILKGGLAPDLIGLVAQNVENRVGGEEDVGIGGEVWRALESARARERTRPDLTYCGWS